MVILRATTFDLIAEALHHKTTGAATSENAGTDLGVYGSSTGFFNEPRSYLPASTDIAPRSPEVANVSYSYQLPPALWNRYRDQSVYFVKKGREALNSGKWTGEVKSIIIDMLQKLVACESDGEITEIVVPSPELLEILFVIDKAASESDISPTDGNNLTDTLLSCMKNLDPACRKESADILIDFILNICKKSIWKTVCESSHCNEINRTANSFRTDVQVNEIFRNKAV